MEASALGEQRLPDLNSSLKEGLVYPTEKVIYTSAIVNTCITISLEVVCMLVDFSWQAT